MNILGYKYTLNFDKSTDEIIRTLVRVVSRGGSLLLNVAPGPDGQLDSTAYVRLKEVGEWLKVNGEAVYGTRAFPVEQYADDMEGATAKGQVVYFFGDEGGRWFWSGADKPKASVVGSGRPLKVRTRDGRTWIELPEDVLPAHGRGRMIAVKLEVR